MADSKPPSPPEPAPSPAPGAPPAGGDSGSTTYKAPQRNPAFRMLMLPKLPKRLPSRNWTIFLTISTAFAAAIIYDKREKKRATARWARTVSYLAKEPLPNAFQMPRRLTVLMEAPPGDGLRVAQDHFVEYVKPILKASGLDWEFVQGRQQGDVRAAVAEKIRRRRWEQERPDEELEGDTKEAILKKWRQRHNTPEWQGVEGDLIIGRHTWKEYIRGVHEGWLGPLDAPPQLETTATMATTPDLPEGENPEGEKKPEGEKPTEPETKKPDRPPQPRPYNTSDDYPSSGLPPLIPNDFSPSAAIPLPHLLGFSSTPTRLMRFLNRRKLADDIGREVAAVCFAAAREYREDADGCEQQGVLEAEERDWHKSVWAVEKDDDKKNKTEGDEGAGKAPQPPKERIWASPVVVDPRIGMRMRRFELPPEEEVRAREIVVPEEDVEGWIKGGLRSMVRWGRDAMFAEEEKPYVGDVDQE